jgi:hypothetical protein
MGAEHVAPVCTRLHSVLIENFVYIKERSKHDIQSDFRTVGDTASLAESTWRRMTWVLEFSGPERGLRVTAGEHREVIAR